MMPARLDEDKNFVIAHARFLAYIYSRIIHLYYGHAAGAALLLCPMQSSHRATLNFPKRLEGRGSPSFSLSVWKLDSTPRPFRLFCAFRMHACVVQRLVSDTRIIFGYLWPRARGIWQRDTNCKMKGFDAPGVSFVSRIWQRGRSLCERVFKACECGAYSFNLFDVMIFLLWAWRVVLVEIEVLFSGVYAIFFKLFCIAVSRKFWRFGDVWCV